MLLKIYTDKNSLVVVENITAIEVHNSTFEASNKQQIVDGGISCDPALPAANTAWEPFGPNWDKDQPKPPASFYGTGQTPRLVGTPYNPNKILVKFIDYKKDDTWHRLAIDFFGTCYLCNDQGKTIERIEEPGRLTAA